MDGIRWMAQERWAQGCEIYEQMYFAFTCESLLHVPNVVVGHVIVQKGWSKEKHGVEVCFLVRTHKPPEAQVLQLHASFVEQESLDTHNLAKLSDAADSDW